MFAALTLLVVVPVRVARIRRLSSPSLITEPTVKVKGLFVEQWLRLGVFELACVGWPRLARELAESFGIGRETANRYPRLGEWCGDAR